jgi:hypothetical protein
MKPKPEELTTLPQKKAARKQPIRAGEREEPDRDVVDPGRAKRIRAAGVFY